ncbi:MAG: hypothetical protein PHT56_03805 [Candidatus Izemoplasmatales bacterium]|nr:hypothetical protein [Candidatus Izemoplasmatales bacterium]MDY0372654.1 hypothetical protein [Candidatus Izemoplasmatales bacterium]
MNPSTTKSFKKITLFLVSIVVKMSSTIMMGFSVPRLLGVVQFGYFRLFSLFTVYTSLLHFGLIDGFLLSNRSTTPSSNPTPKLKTVALGLLWLEGCFASIGILASILFLKAELQSIVAMVFLNLLVQNFISLYQTVAQTRGMSQKVSQGSLFLSFINILIVGAVFLFKIRDFLYVTILVVIANYWVFFWYFWCFRRLLFESPSTKTTPFIAIKTLTQKGFWYLVAYIVPTMIVVFNNHLVWFLFPVEDFSIYAFSVNMTIFATIACANLAKITDDFYPKLTKAEQIASYDLLNGAVIFLVLIGISAYFLLQWTTPTFLPDYIASIPLFRIVLGLLLFSCPLGVVTHAYFKLAGKNARFIQIGSGMLVLSLGLNFLVFQLDGSLMAFATSLFASFLIFYVITQVYLIVRLKIPWLRSDGFLLLGGGIYLYISEMENYALGAFLYLFSILLLFGLFYGRDWKKGIRLYRLFMDISPSDKSKKEVAS